MTSSDHYLDTCGETLAQKALEELSVRTCPSQGFTLGKLLRNNPNKELYATSLGLDLDPSPVSLAQHGDLIINLLAQVGYISEACLPATIDSHTKKDSSIVTNVDLAISEYVIEKLEKITGFPVISEECISDYPYERRKELKSFWLVDPLDGTKGFARHTDEYVHMLSFIHNQESVFTCIYLPKHDHQFVIASKGEGAYIGVASAEFFVEPAIKDRLQAQQAAQQTNDQTNHQTNQPTTITLPTKGTLHQINSEEFIYLVNSDFQNSFNIHMEIHQGSFGVLGWNYFDELALFQNSLKEFSEELYQKALAIPTTKALILKAYGLVEDLELARDGRILDLRMLVDGKLQPSRYSNLGPKAAQFLASLASQESELVGTACAAESTDSSRAAESPDSAHTDLASATQQYQPLVQAECENFASEQDPQEREEFTSEQAKQLNSYQKSLRDPLYLNAPTYLGLTDAEIVQAYKALGKEGLDNEVGTQEDLGKDDSAKQAESLQVNSSLQQINAFFTLQKLIKFHQIVTGQVQVHGELSASIKEYQAIYESARQQQAQAIHKFCAEHLDGGLDDLAAEKVTGGFDSVVAGLDSVAVGSDFVNADSDATSPSSSSKLANLQKALLGLTDNPEYVTQQLEIYRQGVTSGLNELAPQDYQNIPVSYSPNAPLLPTSKLMRLVTGTTRTAFAGTQDATLYAENYTKDVMTSAGLKTFEVVMGKATCYFLGGFMSEWDLAPAMCIFNEIGCKILDFATARFLPAKIFNKKHCEVLPLFMTTHPAQLNFFIDLPELAKRNVPQVINRRLAKRHGEGKMETASIKDLYEDIPELYHK